MARKKIFISCAGLGMGNAARVAALIEELIDFDIVVYSWGAGFSFLERFRETHQLKFKLLKLQSFLCSRNIFSCLKAYFINCYELRKGLVSEKPCLIIADSDYHLPAFLGFSLTRWYVGQAADVIRRQQLFRPKLTLRGRFNYLIREKLDFVFQRTFFDRVFVPCFHSPEVQTCNKVSFIDLIVRREFLNSPSASGEKTGVLLSGSKLCREDFDALLERSDVELIGSDNHEVVISHAHKMDHYSTFICQGGLSSLSEILTRKKPMFVVPLPDHPEQILNALEIQRIGAGCMVNPIQLKEIDIRFLTATFLPASHEYPGFQGAKQLGSFLRDHILRTEGEAVGEEG